MPGDFSSGARLEIRITPADVGKRVSVRQLVEIADGHPTFTDTVGVLVSWDGGVVCVTRRTGETIAIAETSLVAGKVVPPAPKRRTRGVPEVTADELERVASRAWPSSETERLGDWTLRASGGFTRRANSVLTGGDPGVALDEALDRIAAWYAERGLPPLVQLPDSSPYAGELAGRGWTREGDTLVRTAPLAPLTLLPPAAPGEDVTLSRTPDAAWLAAYHRTGELAEAAVKVVSGGPSVWFATMPGAIGRAVVDGRWALFGAVEVIPERRRRGLATAVMGALARQAAAEGATAACLQVEADNAGARALYDRMGFTDHHGYHYRRRSA
ncbi:GNAT family N-acetyltransferase [Actinacidiphila rubida]|uniref:Acetyltransferase (GNAT) family protein n=1 Tax=Actinacidiphila rubida TaxID=310780 RepID=A0A1H8HAQ5_9ACTN|nr:GNAT family N-acetyltransferase [Actinacidiphila rubida]SEN53134.1 Acetyltransferase (GNAT) family protein [Actinacidiphila rubida]